MIYFGQEVGEPGLGSEGFQGEDGRTTIFDYWGVPEHQKWMNGGKFDGALLSAEQKQLRQYYVDLLNIAATNAAITEGDYIDLTEHNINAGNFNSKVSAYIRYSGPEKLLIVTSFSPTEENVKVQIPKDVLTKVGLEGGGEYSGKDLLAREMEISLKGDFLFDLKLNPYRSFIFKIK
jgi:hypothetical protein